MHVSQQNNTGIQKRLTQEAEDLRGIQSGIVTTIIPQLVRLTGLVLSVSALDNFSKCHICVVVLNIQLSECLDYL